MPRDTGSPRADAEYDFLRVRRHQTLSKLAHWMRQDAQDVGETLSFSEVLDALGRRGERSLGVQLIPLDQIVGSVDKVRDFDRRFRPTSDRSRQRWERLAEKSRLGEYLPPIDVLLTHAPPLGLGDGDDKPHEGIEALHTVLERLEPSWHLHGHIHPYGQRMPDRQVGPTTIRNVIPWRMLDIEPRTPDLVAPGSRRERM